MALHDWAKTSGWEGVHLFWMTELARDVKARLPAGFRAYLGTVPYVAVEAPAGKPDVSVRRHSQEVPAPEGSSAGTAGEPDVEVAVAQMDPEPALFIERDGELIAALELIYRETRTVPNREPCTCGGT
jgi:hypothetical protein